MPMDWEKWQQKKGPQIPSPDLEKVAEKFRNFKGRIPSAMALIGLAFLVWLLSGIYIVAPDEMGVVKRFGAFTRTTGPGPHYHIPYPLNPCSNPRLLKSGVSK